MARNGRLATADPLALHPQRDALSAVALLAVGLWVGVPRFRWGSVLGDEGFLAHGAMRVAGGEIPNLDFVSLQPPLSLYAAAALFEGVAPSLLALRWLGLGLSLAVLVAGFALARLFARPELSALALAPLAVTGMAISKFVPFAVWWGTLFALTSAALVLFAVRVERRRWAFASGLAAALTLASRHDQGLYVCLSIAGYLSLRAVFAAAGSGRVARSWLAGLAALSLPCLTYWAAVGALPSMFQQLVVFPLTTYAATSAVPWPELQASASMGQNLAVALYYVPALAVVLGAATLGRRAATRALAGADFDLALLVALAGLFYVQVFARSDLYHLVITLAPAYVLLACGLEGCARWLEAAEPHAPVWRGVLALAGVGALGAAVLWLSAPAFLEPAQRERRLVALPRAGVWVPPREASVIEGAVAFFRNNVRAEESILALPYQPIYYFLAERRNPTRWLYLWPGDQTPDDHAELLREVQADLPGAVVLSAVKRMKEFAPEIVAFVDREYVPVARLGGAFFYLAKDRAPKAEDSEEPATEMLREPAEGDSRGVSEPVPDAR